MYTFNYHVPKNIDEATALFEKSSEPKYLAGGMTLVASMKQRLTAPSDLIDLSKIDTLKKIILEGKNLKIGALTTHNSISKNEEIQSTISGLCDLSNGIGDQAIRNFGTIGGSIANADPAADWPAAILALKSQIETNVRIINGEEFFKGMFETILDEKEIITQILFEIPSYFTYVKFQNPASRYAIVGIGLAIYDKIARVSVTGASHTPFRASEIESALSNNFEIDNIPLNSVSSENLNNDIHASAEYRSHLIDVLTKSAVRTYTQ